MPNRDCPVCNTRASKVDDVVAAGTAGISRTDLARRLAFTFMVPAKPEPKSFAQHFGIGIGLLVLGLVCGIPTYQMASIGGDGLITPGVAAVACLALPLVAGLVTVLAAGVSMNADRGSLDQRLANWRVDEQQWIRRSERYDKLFYCSRDGIVFSESNPGVYVDSSDWRQLTGD